MEQVTDTSSGSESDDIEPEANTTLEGTLDTELASTGGDSTNLEELLPVTDTTADETDDQGETADSGETAEEGTGSDTTTEVTVDTTTVETDADTASSETGTTVAAGTDPEVVISEIASEEVAGQTTADYELDTSAGKWYTETPGEITSDSDAASTKAKIAELRKQIKEIMKKFAAKEIKRKDAMAQIKDLRAQIAKLRAKVGNGGNKIEGIYTAWANQDLFLNINKGESGWYRLIVIAKNHGTLPDSYDRFSFNVTNETGDVIGSLTVKASDKVYNRGSIDFELDQPAGSKLNIVWTNDYYVKDKYDANVNIKKVVLKKIKQPKEKAVKNIHLQGDQYSYMDGRWFFDKQSAYTCWSGQEIGYTFKNMEEGVYEITIEAANYGSLPLPKNYKNFDLIVESDYDSANMAIEASDKGWKKETVTMSFPKGTTTLYITWTNDTYKEGSYDANFMMKSIQVKKVKDSNLTAYLLKTKPGNKIFILAAFLMISGVLLGIYMKNRSASSES